MHMQQINERRVLSAMAPRRTMGARARVARAQEGARGSTLPIMASLSRVLAQPTTASSTSWSIALMVMLCVALAVFGFVPAAAACVSLCILRTFPGSEHCTPKPAPLKA